MAELLPEWTIDAAIPEDAAALADMHAKSFLDAYFKKDSANALDVQNEAIAFITAARISDREALINESLLHGDQLFYYQAVDAERNPLGLIAGFKTDEKQEVEALYVHPEFKGRGIGRELMNSFIGWADPHRTIEVGVYKGNEPAQRFYARMGFVAMGDKESWYSFLPEITMERPAGGDR